MTPCSRLRGSQAHSSRFTGQTARVRQTVPVNEYAITVVGRDRPGTVADVAAALAALGLNLTDSTMTLLRGHFAMMLMCAGEATEADVTSALAPLTADGNLLATTRTLPPDPEPVRAGSPHQLVVHGADRLGIVAAVTEVLATADGNITDLSTRLTGALYSLTAEVDMPARADLAAVRHHLAEVAGRLGVEASLQPVEADML
jgi:glycine cleavage system transcriptional repressor